MSLNKVRILIEYLKRINEKDAVFIWIPKTAGTSIYSCLKYPPKLKKTKLVKRYFSNKGLVTFGHMDYSLLLSKGYISPNFNKNAFKFAFVRNPYFRTYSLFKYFQKIKKIPSNWSFLDFCAHLFHNGIDKIGLYNSKRLSQANPQNEWLKRINVDYIGSVENIEFDLNLILTSLGRTRESIPRLNTSVKNFDLDVFTDDTVKIINYFYKEDFENFGYTIFNNVNELKSFQTIYQ